MSVAQQVFQRVDVLGSHISACDTNTALRLLIDRTDTGNGGYICFTNVHAAVMGVRDPEFQGITNSSFLSLADGKPVYWVAKATSTSAIGHVAGPDFMHSMLRRYPSRNHFFYGSTPAVLERLIKQLRHKIPEINICGSFSPPFRSLTQSERIHVVQMIRESRAEFVWISLGAPKQERWMAEMWADLKPAVLLGVGAAFDFHSGMLKRAPVWVRCTGFEWLYRLMQEPKRLWKRYLITNTLFIYYVVRQRFR